MLLVFFYFAPSAEVGALRWMALTRFGAERGWAVDVVSLHPSFMGNLDTSRLTQLPPGVRLFGFSGVEPMWYRMLIEAWSRARRTAPRDSASGMSGHLDGDMTGGLSSSNASSWRRSFRSRMHFRLAGALSERATNLGVALGRTHKYDVIVSSGPPHAAHDAAREIATRSGVPFAMDLRDPWSDEIAMPEEMDSGAWRRASQAHERRCVSAASLVVVTSQAHEVLQLSKYPDLRGRVRTVMNGADREPLPPSRIGRRFVIAYSGMIYLGRNPRSLFQAAARVAKETNASPSEFGVEFMGDELCEGIPLTTMATEAGIAEYFRSHAFRPRNEALEFLSGAALLVSLSARTPTALPAKLFEYTRFDAWLLTLAEPRSAPAELLQGSEASVVAPDDVDGIAAVIRRRFDEFRAGVRPRALNRDGRFDRATQSAVMFDALERLSGTGRPGATPR
jgi:glycosyltransferase involved in cell wall biosynthesis